MSGGADDPTGDLALLTGRRADADGETQRVRDKQDTWYHDPSGPGYAARNGKRPLRCARFPRSARRGRQGATAEAGARRARSPAYTGGPAAASSTATSTPGNPIARLRTSSATPRASTTSGSAASATSHATPSGTRNAPRNVGSARRSRISAANSSPSAAVYKSTSPASRPPNGSSAKPEYTRADTSTALRGVPRASVRA